MPAYFLLFGFFNWTIRDGVRTGNKINIKHRPMLSVIPAKDDGGVWAFWHAERTVEGRMLVSEANQIEQ